MGYIGIREKKMETTIMGFSKGSGFMTPKACINKS